MATLVFVHGIGVRDAQYPAVWPNFRRRIESIRPALDLQLCGWGADNGARFTPDVRAEDPRLAAVDNTGDRAALWQQLYQDPYWELVLLEEEAAHAGAPALAPGSRLPGVDLPLRLDRLKARLASGHHAVRASADPLCGDLAELGLAEEVPEAMNEVVRHPAALACIRREDVLGGQVRPALARAMVAAAVLRAGGPAVVILSGADAERVASHLTEELGGEPMSAGGWLSRLALKLVRPHLASALSLPTWLAVAGRDRLAGHATQYAGDVLLYLARGERIRSAVADFINRQAPPVFLVGHSLGGVICFDLLAMKQLTGVERLVTVGSQVPYLYAIDALPGHPRGGGPLPPLPRWTNVYDPRDLLSFPAEPVLTPKIVCDRRVDSDAPFPMSHLTYFRSAAFYGILGDALP